MTYILKFTKREQFNIHLKVKRPHAPLREEKGKEMGPN
jgi:hypothetical protein